MIEIKKEEHICAQSDKPFACYVIVVNGSRIFATEDEVYLKRSLETFREDGVTIVLECDRNSAELPDLGPAVDVEIWGPLCIQKVGGDVCFLSGSRDDRKCHAKAPYSEWVAAVNTLIAL